MAYTDVLAGAMATQGPGSSGVEQRIENPRVGGSIPPPGTIFTNIYNSIAIAQFLLPALHTHRTVFRVLVRALMG